MEGHDSDCHIVAIKGNKEGNSGKGGGKSSREGSVGGAKSWKTKAGGSSEPTVKLEPKLSLGYSEAYSSLTCKSASEEYQRAISVSTGAWEGHRPAVTTVDLSGLTSAIAEPSLAFSCLSLSLLIQITTRHTSCCIDVNCRKPCI